MPIKITVEESEKTSLQTPKGKENPDEKTSLQSSQGTETEELPPAEPLALPDDDELKPVDTIVIKDGEGYKRVHVYEVQKQAKEQEGAKCQFCKGTGKVIVEKKGIKECPRCEGEGYTSKPQEEFENHKDDQQIDDITQEEEIQGGIQPETEEQIEQDNSENEMEDFQEEQEPEDSGFGEPEEDLDFGEPEEEKVNTKAFESFVGKKIQVLKQRHPDKAVTLLMGTEVNGDYGSKKIKGTLAYAGVSLNDRIYLPEELAKGDGMTLPLLLNHSSTAGAEGELYRLQDDARQALEGGKDYKVGEVTLTWKPEALTLYYEGEVDHPFFQKEVDEADMAVSLGIYYDSDSPMLCNDQCYTVIKGAEFREVSLVYHAGFPVATIEAYEKLLKKKAMESMKGEPNINPEKANEDLNQDVMKIWKAWIRTKDGIPNIIFDEDQELWQPENIITQVKNDWIEFAKYEDVTYEEAEDIWETKHVNSLVGFKDDRYKYSLYRGESKASEGLSKEELEQRISELQNYLEHAITQEIPVMPKMRKMHSLIKKMKKINPSYTNSWWDYYGISAWNESKATEDGMYANFGKRSKEDSWSVLTVASDLMWFETREEAEDYMKNWDRSSYQISPPKSGRSNWNKEGESKANEWTPSQGHDWQPPTDKDYKDLPKPDKNQKMAGSHDEPKYRGKNRDTDGKFSKEGAGDFLETPELQKIRNDWDNVMTHEEKVDMLTGMAYMSQINKTFDNLLWETKESVALTIGQRLGLDVDMGTFYGERYLKMLQNQYMD